MAAADEQKLRTVTLSNFTRNLNKLNKLLDTGASITLVTPQFEKMKEMYEKLEVAQDEFLKATDIDVENHKDGLQYMNSPDDQQEKAVQRYSLYLKTTDDEQRVLEQASSRNVDEARKQREIDNQAAQELKSIDDRKKQFDSESAQLTMSIATFKNMTLNVKDSLSDISVVDRRQEWLKVETEFSTLKGQLVRIAGIDHTQDITQIKSLFENDVQKVFMDAQKHVLTELKDYVPPDATNPPVVNSTIRREAVKLPTFDGNEETSTPFLTFPIWKKQWETMIVDYPERFRAIMLIEKVDECARAQFIGYETDYEEAMKHLTRYYGDKHKVVTCVMQEVMNQSEIKEANYKELIKYSVNLQTNFARLKAVGLEKDMSGTLSMVAMVSMVLEEIPQFCWRKLAQTFK